jgi:hypothetical protein
VALGLFDVGARSHSIPICSREISCRLVSSLYLVAGKTRGVGSSACAGGGGGGLASAAAYTGCSCLPPCGETNDPSARELRG